MTQQRTIRPSLNGLYSLKPWYAQRLEPVVATLESHHITANAVSVSGVFFAACAGSVLAFGPADPLAAAVVAVLLLARLGCANMDGTLARRATPRRFGGVVNEIGDRLADMALLVGFWPHLGWATFGVLLAATLPSWASLAVTATTGGPRSNAGPVGKTERCLLAVLAVGSGWYAAFAVVIAAGSVVTSIERLRVGARISSTGARS